MGTRAIQWCSLVAMGRLGGSAGGEGNESWVQRMASPLPLEGVLVLPFQTPTPSPDVRPTPDHGVGGIALSWPLVYEGRFRCSDTARHKEVKQSAATGVSPQRSL